MQVDINLTPTGSLIEIPRKIRNAFTYDGQSETIAARTWGHASECKAVCLLVHGLGAHSGWFEALARRLKVRRIYSLAYDQVGAGKRRGEPLLMKQQWLDDLECALDYLASTVPDKPIILMGNSMGAVIALKAALSKRKDQLAGLVLFSPGFDGNPNTFSLGYKVKALFNALTDPDRVMPLPYTTDDITPDPRVRNWLTNDAGPKLTVPARTLFELLKLTSETRAGAKNLQCPVIMFTAGNEKIVNNIVNREVYDRLNAPNKKLVHYPEAWHDLMFDEAIDKMADDLLAYLNTCVLHVKPNL